MACNCIDEMDAKLADYNTKLSVTFGFPRDGSESYTMPTIGTEKLDRKVRKGPALAIAGFCPFCGAAYRAEPAA